MFCPYCGSEESRVVDKRDNRDTGVTRRRRECISCSKRFTTYERIENITINVKKRSGNTEEFDREKLKRGIMKAMKKRKIEEEQINELLTEVEQSLLNSDKQEVSTVDIGQMVLARLIKIDKLGALLFAAVYKDFQTLEDLEKELKILDQSR